MNRTIESVLPLMTAVVMTLGLVGCGATNPGAPGPSPTPDPSPQPQPDPNPTPAPNPTPQPEPAEDQDPSGVWRFQSGYLFSYFEYDYQLEYLVLNQDGSARMIHRNQVTGALQCFEGFHAALEDTLLWSFGYFGGELGGGTQLFRFDMPDDNSLSLSGAGSEDSVFTREAELPETFDCGTLTILNRFDGLDVYPYDYSGLAFDGTVLWFTAYEDNKTYPISPESGTLGAPLTLSNGRYVHASQGLDFWAHDSNGIANRVDRANTVVDAVNTQTDLAIPIDIEALAFDSTDNVLWMHGYDDDNDRISRFLKVNAEIEPDALLDNREFNEYIRAMTWDGQFMWALVGYYPVFVLQIDMDTFQVVATYEGPKEFDVSWNGIAAVDSSLFMIGQDYYQDKGVLVEVTRQQ